MKLITVIHIIKKDINFILRQCQKAFENGSYGIFIIPYYYGISPEDINQIYYQIRKVYPIQFIGINYLAHVNEYLNIIPPTVSALWTDEGIGNKDDFKLLDKINLVKNKLGFLYFGGFYHKGNNYNFNKFNVPNKKSIALQYIDVLTTTGLGTGIEIKQTEFNIITSGIPKERLAMASGLDYSNIHKYINTIGFAIVGSSLEKTDEVGNIKRGHLDSSKIKKLVNKITPY